MHQLQSGLGWDNYFPPEGEPLFNEMAEAVASAPTANLNIVPAPAAGSVWLDGNPAPVVGSQLRIPVGKHFIQFVGDRVLTYEIDVRAPGDIELTVPGLLATTSMEWVATTEKSQGYSNVFANIRDEGSTLYASFEGSIWSTSIGSGEWQELVAQGAADQAEILRSERYAKAPKTSGTVLTSVGGAFLVTGLATLPSMVSSVAKYSRASAEYKRVFENSLDDALLNEAYDDYTDAQAALAPAVGVTGATLTIGGVGLGIGVSMFKKAKLRRAELPTLASVLARLN